MVFLAAATYVGLGRRTTITAAVPAAGGTRGDERCDYFVQVTITTHDVLRLNIGGSTQAVLQGKDTPQSKMHDVLVATSPQP